MSNSTRHEAERIVKTHGRGDSRSQDALTDTIDAALQARDERVAKIAESHYVNHKGDPATGLIHVGQCHQAIADAIRKDD